MIDVQPYLTPYKFGRPVLTGSGRPGAFDRDAVDCPFVFWHNQQFYMLYVGFDGEGYQTALATSVDLFHWEHLDVILRRGAGGSWDAHNSAGTWILRENPLDAPPVLKKWDGRYWLVYHTYPKSGYEAGSGRIGLAWTDDEALLHWQRLPMPILAPEDGADWERGGLYKECLIEHEGTFYLFYNAKNADTRWIEQIGIARSTNLRDWTRNADNPVLRVSAGCWDSGFVSDPCVARHGGAWVMYYFGYDYARAQEGVACSDNLLDWEKHPEPIIRTGAAGEIDVTYAHKPSVITHEGVLYHFYCACRPSQPEDPTVHFGTQFRTITVAASQVVFPPLTE